MVTGDTPPHFLVRNYGVHQTHTRLLMGNPRANVNKAAAPVPILLLSQGTWGLNPKLLSLAPAKVGSPRLSWGMMESREALTPSPLRTSECNQV